MENFERGVYLLTCSYIFSSHFVPGTLRRAEDNEKLSVEGWPPENSEEADERIAVASMGPAPRSRRDRLPSPLGPSVLYGRAFSPEWRVLEGGANSADIPKGWTGVWAVRVSNREMAREIQIREQCARFLWRGME